MTPVRLVLALLFSVLVSSPAFSCEEPPVLADVSEGLQVDPDTGHFVISSGEPATLSVALEACQAAESIVVQLPSSVDIQGASRGCEPSEDGSLVCDRPAAEELDNGRFLQLVDYTIVADPADGASETLSWTVEALFGEVEAMSARSAEDDDSVTMDQIVILNNAWVNATQPPNGATFFVEPGQQMDLIIYALYQGDFQDSRTRILRSPGSGPGDAFEFVSQLLPTPITCSGQGTDTATCTGAALDEHEGQLRWNVPTTPGTYNGTINATACGNTGGGNCVSDGNSFTIIVEDTSCDVSVGKSWQSDLVDANGNPAVFVNQPFEWRINVSAPSGNAANVDGITVLDTLPSNIRYLGYSGTNWSCSGNVGGTGGSVNCSYSGSLSPGQSASTLILHVEPTSTANAINQVSASSSNCGGASTTDLVQPLDPGPSFANVVTSKSGPSSVNVGDTFNWTINVDSQGPNAAEDYVLTDALPSGVSFVGVSATGPLNCSHSSGVVTCTAGSLPEGSYTVTITVQATGSGTLTNTCVSTAAAGATDDEDCEDSVGSTPQADLAVSATNGGTVYSGEDVSYSFSISNNGPSTAQSVQFSHSLPSGTTLVGASGTNGMACAQVSGGISCSRSSMAPGASSSVFVTITTATDPGTVNFSGSASSSTPDPNLSNNTGFGTYQVEPHADLSLSKSGPGQVNAGDSFSYSLSVANDGPNTAASVVVSDNLPTGVTFNSGSGAGFSCGASGGTVTCTRGSWAAGSSGTITLNVTAPNEGGDINNCASIDSDTDDLDTSNNSDCHPTTVNAQADLALTKSAPSSVTAASSFNYTLSVTNNGPSTAEDLVVTDTLPPEVNFNSVSASGWSCGHNSGTVTCSRGSLNSGGAGTITINVTAPDDEASLDNCGEVGASTPDPEPANNGDCASTSVVPEADLALSKNGPGQVDAEEEYSYSIVVTNSGPSAAAGAIISDDLPAGVSFVSGTGGGWSCNESGGTVTCTRSNNIPSGASRTATITVEAPSEGGDVTNCAATSADTNDPDLSNNNDCHTTNVNPLADLTLSKGGPATVFAGAAYSYTLSVANDGPSNAASISVIDTLPAGVSFNSASGSGWSCGATGGTVTCTRPSWSTGASGTITINVTAPDDPGSIDNCATISASTDDPDSSNNSDCHPTTVEPAADLSIVKSGPAGVNAADSYSYTLEVTNHGPSDATDVVVSDSLPSGVVLNSIDSAFFSCGATGQDITCTAASMSAGLTQSITLNVTAPDEGGTLQNCAAVSSDVEDPNTGNNEDCHSVDVTPQADLVASKTGPSSVEAGESFTYQLLFTNEGPSTADNVQITDSVPAGVNIESYSSDDISCLISNDQMTCTTSSLPSGGAIQIALEVTGPDEAESLNNCASISSSTNDPIPGNNEDCHATSVLARADISVEKTSVDNPVAAGHEIEWVVTVTNAGPSTAENVEITDTLPSEVDFVGIDDVGTPFDCSENGNVISCVAAAVPVGVYDIVITAMAPDDPQEVTNLCILDTTTPPPSGTEPVQECEDTVTVERAVDITLSKQSIPGVVVAASEYEYLITVGNNGPSDAIDIEITDALPTDVIFLSFDSVHACAYDSGEHEVVCQIDELPAGTTTEITLNVQAPDEGGDITNICVAEYPGIELDPATLDCEADTEVTPEANLSVSKIPSSGVVEAGQPFTYEIALANSGPSTAENVEVTDTLPPELSFDGVSADSPLTCGEAGGTVTCSAAELPVGDYSIIISVIAPDEGGQVNNVCVVASGTDDPDPIGPDDCDDGGVVIDPRAELAVSKTAADDSVLAGEPISWTVSFENLGPSTAEDVELIDVLPGAVELVSFDGPAGMSCNESAGAISCFAANLPVGSYQLTIQATAPDQPQDVTNTCTLDGSLQPPSGGAPLPLSCAHTVAVERAVDISLSKVASEDTVVAGSEFDYTITVSNAGPSDAIDIEVTDILPSEVSFVAAGPHPCAFDAAEHEVVCNISELVAGDSTEIVITVQAPDEGMELTNVCVADYPGHELDPGTLDCEADTEVTPEANLSVIKTPSDTTVPVDQPFHYQIVLTNSGPSTAEDVVITDELPEEVSFLSVDADAPLDCSETAGIVTCTAAELPVGDYGVTIHVQAPAEGGEFANVCVVDTGTDDPDPIGPEDCEDGGVIAEPQANLQLEKRALDQPGGSVITEIQATEAFTWEIRIDNLGPSTAESVEVLDSVPAGFAVNGATGEHDDGTPFTCNLSGQDVECIVGDMAPDSWAVINIDVQAPDDGGQFTNVCTYTSETMDPAPSICEGSIEVESISDVSVSKLAFIEIDGPGGPETEVVTEVDAGSTFFYRVTVSNDGPSTAEDLVLVDNLPPEIEVLDVSGFDDGCALDDTTVTCSTDSLGAGASIHLIVEAVAPEAELVLVNLATVSASTTDPDDSNNDVEHELLVVETPIVGLAKGQTMVEYLGNGEFEARLMFTLINYGNVPLTDVQVTDDFSGVFPPSVVWSLSNLTVEGDLATVNENFDGLVDIEMLSGDEVLPVDGEAHIRLRVQFIPDTEAGPFWNQAYAAGFSTVDIEVTDTSTNGLDPNPDGTHPNNHTDPTPIQYDEDPAIGLAKWVEDRSYLGDGLQRFDLAILVENWGNVPLSNVQVLDNLVYTFTPEHVLEDRGRSGAVRVEEIILEEVVDITVEGDLSLINEQFDGVGDTAMLPGIESLPVGGSAVIRFGVIVAPEDDDYGPYYNRALGSGWSPLLTKAEDYSQEGMDSNPSGSGDPTDDNDPTLLWAMYADVAAEKEMITPDVAPGEAMTWRVSVTNLGPDEGREIVVVDFLPDNVTFESVEEGPFSCSVSGLEVTCELDSLEADETASFYLTAIAPAEGGPVLNTCVADNALPDPDLDNNNCESETSVGAQSALSVAKEAVGPVYAGQPFSYLLTVTNGGPSDAEGVVVMDDLPDGLGFENVSAENPFDCTHSEGVVSCFADVLPLGSYEILIDVVAPSEPGPITNVCVIDAANDIVGDPDSCEHTVEPAPSAALSLVKYADPESVAPGQTFDWVIEVRQDGPSSASDVLVVDQVPEPSVVLGAAADSPFDCDVDGNTVSCLAGNLPVGVYELRIETQAPSEPGPLSNLCVIDSGTHDPEPPEECGGTVVVDDESTLVTTAVASKSEVFVGEEWIYTITLENQGASDLTEADLVMAMNGGAGEKLGLDSNGLGYCETNGPDGAWCIVDVLGVGNHLQAQIRMRGASPGQHTVHASGAAANPLTPDSVRNASASVTVRQHGLPDDDAHPIPVMGRPGLIVLSALMLLLGLYGMRFVPQIRDVRQR